jgi:hypothetical protein
MSRAKIKPEMTVRELAKAGGDARAKALSPARMKEIARQAAMARWSRRKKATA